MKPRFLQSNTRSQSSERACYTSREAFGRVEFEIQPFETNGGIQKREIAILNEQQATLLVTYCKNTETVRKFKVALVKAFYEMRELLHSQCPVAAEISVARLTVEHQYAIQSAVGKRVHTSGASYQAVYQALKNRFKVPKYTYILERDFEEAIRFIETCDLRVPQSEPITERKAQVLASAEFCEHVRTLVYCWRYLFKKEIDLVYQTMRAMGSPHAPMLWEAIHDLDGVLENLEVLFGQLPPGVIRPRWNLRPTGLVLFCALFLLFAHGIKKPPGGGLL